MKSPIKWTGGKHKEIEKFKKYIPHKYDCYVEPFFGGGATFWYLSPNAAVINDINEYLINFFNVLKNDYNSLIDELSNYKLSKSFFNEIVYKLNNKLYKSKVEKAAIFYYLNKTSFSGKWRVNKKGKYNNTWGGYKKENFKYINKIYSEKLKNAVILNKDYREILVNFYNKSNAFLFLDPPYLDCDSMYTTIQDFAPIYEYIRNFINDCKCKVMLIVKGDEYIKQLFNNYIKEEYFINYRHNSLSKKIKTHLIISNY